MRLVSPGLLLALALGVPTASPAASPSQIRAELLAAINASRAHAGVEPLRLSSALSTVAQARAEEISRKDDVEAVRWSEERVDGEVQRAGYRWSRWVESEHAAVAPD